MSRIFILLMAGLRLASWTYGQESVIHGTATDLAGDSLEFFTYREPFFSLKNTVAKIAVSDDGSFSFTVHSKSTECIWTEIGPYLAYVFIRPGNRYNLELPVTSGMSDEWHYNPYFRKAFYHLSVQSMDCRSDSSLELNHAIRKFEEEYEPFKDRQLLRYYSPEPSEARLDSFRKANPVPPGLCDSAYFRRYRKYKLGTLEFAVSAYNTDTLLSEYFQNCATDFRLPPYDELFRLVMEDYFRHLSKKEEFSDIYHVFGQHSYSKMKSYLRRDPLMRNDTIFEAVLLNEIYTSYYSGDFSKEAMIAFADSVKRMSALSLSSDMADELIHKFTRLSPGHQAPDFRLTDTAGKTYTMKDFNGKYVCLGFCDMQSMSSLIELEYVKAVSVRHSDILSVVTIISSGDAEEVARFAEQNRLTWTVLSAAPQSMVFQAYNVKAFPVFFLIDKEGKLVRSPVANPSAGFEQVFYGILKERSEI